MHVLPGQSCNFRDIIGKPKGYSESMIVILSFIEMFIEILSQFSRKYITVKHFPKFYMGCFSWTGLRSYSIFFDVPEHLVKFKILP